MENREFIDALLIPALEAEPEVGGAYEIWEFRHGFIVHVVGGSAIYVVNQIWTPDWTIAGFTPDTILDDTLILIYNRG
jgi:hypothetical protein